MRGLITGLLVAIIVLALALAATTVGSLGVAAVGWLLQRWFDLTQWQGSVIALGVLVFKGFIQPTTPWNDSGLDDYDDDDWDDEDDEDEDDEPPIVPWRRSRPTPGNLAKTTPIQKPSSGAKKRK